MLKLTKKVHEATYTLPIACNFDALWMLIWKTIEYR